MKLWGVDNWLKAPLDRDVISRWTVGGGREMGYGLELPSPSDSERFSFLAVGDSGDSEAAGADVSPQDAVAIEMTADAAVPGSSGSATMVLHTGDVVYMTGEKRLYERNFRRPYAAFLTPDSTVDNLTFRLPFLPVPGNHDYYDLGGWAKWLTYLPVLGSGMRALANELFAFSIPEGGSQMGAAYMHAFVDAQADTSSGGLAYVPGERTRLPNRYYRFRHGSVDFFALDSNTLEAPRPDSDTGQVRQTAAKNIRLLEERARVVDGQLRRAQQTLEKWREGYQQTLFREDVSRSELSSLIGRTRADLAALKAKAQPTDCTDATAAVATAERRWKEAAEDLAATDIGEDAVHALRVVKDAADADCQALRALEACLSALPEGDVRSELMSARDELHQRTKEWDALVSPTPPELATTLHKLSEEALDVQRELTLERRRLRYRPEDYDQDQYAWLERVLAESVRERPDGWRVVLLHHPLYTTITNHCEHPDVVELRGNLLSMLQGRVHLVLSGHSHAFEWIGSQAMPNAGLFVTGGGGQVSLRPSIFEPRRLSRYRERYAALRESGVFRCAVSGRGPMAADRENGPLFHYLRVDVEPDRIVVRPVGVRRIDGGFRREEPMPVFYTPELTEKHPARQQRRLAGVQIRRDRPPQPLWG